MALLNRKQRHNLNRLKCHNNTKDKPNNPIELIILTYPMSPPPYDPMPNIVPILSSGRFQFLRIASSMSELAYSYCIFSTSLLIQDNCSGSFIEAICIVVVAEKSVTAKNMHSIIKKKNRIFSILFSLLPKFVIK